MHELFIDYIHGSIMYREQTCIDKKHKPISGIAFYTHGYEDELGTRRFFGNPNSKRAFVIYSGRVLHNQRKIGWDNRELVGDLLTKGMKITRLDIAITDYIDDDLIIPDEIAQMMALGEISGTLAKYGCTGYTKIDVGQPPRIETTYIGSHKRRSKNGIFRAYDKGIELGIMADIITRLELEERGENAHNSAKRIAEGKNMASVIQSRLEFKNERMTRFFDGEPIDLSRGEQLIPSDDVLDNEKRWTWLMKQVAPALRKSVAFDKENGAGNERLLRFLELSGIVE